MATRSMRRSSANVFRDLGFSSEEAGNLRIRAELMARLSGVIEDQGLTRREAAKLLGVAQSRVSHLMRGKIDLFSIDSLVLMLGRAGVRVTLSTRTRRRVA